MYVISVTTLYSYQIQQLMDSQEEPGTQYKQQAA